MSGFTGDAAAALAAIKSGQQIEVSGGDDGVHVPGSEVIDESERYIDADEVRAADGEGSILPDTSHSAADADAETDSSAELSEENSEEAEDADGNQPPEAESDADGNLEELTVTDDRGRRKVKVDFSDREKLRKYVRMAHGARKWQAERDTARTELSDATTKLSELQENWSALETAYQSGGVRGLVELLDGQDAYSEFEKSLVDRYELRKNATPAELEALEAREAAENQSRELERIRQENEDFRKRMEQEREQSEIKALEGRIHPAFDRYRFQGKLGNKDDEHLFDQMLWNTAMRNLSPYEEKGVTITQEIAEKEFARVANSLRRRLNANVKKNVTKAVERKKEDATAVAQKTVMRGVQDSGNRGEAEKLISDGNLTGLLRNWGKYGKLFS